MTKKSNPEEMDTFCIKIKSVSYARKKLAKHNFTFLIIFLSILLCRSSLHCQY